MATMVENNSQSVFNRWAISLLFRQGADQFFEYPARAARNFRIGRSWRRRRKQDGIAGRGDARGLLDRCRQGAALHYQRGIARFGKRFSWRLSR